MALQPFVGPWPLFSFLIFYTVGMTPWTGDQHIARPLSAYTGQQKHRIYAHRYQCLEWNSNPRSECLSGRRQLIPYTARALCSPCSGTALDKMAGATSNVNGLG
jgi:hypothetical protein